MAYRYITQFGRDKIMLVHPPFMGESWIRTMAEDESKCFVLPEVIIKEGEECWKCEKEDGRKLISDEGMEYLKKNKKRREKTLPKPERIGDTNVLIEALTAYRDRIGSRLPENDRKFINEAINQEQDKLRDSG